MPRGRPTQSDIRQRLIEILFVKGTTYGYKLHKYYQKIYGPCTREVVYYHLRKGVDLGEFALAEIKATQAAMWDSGGGARIPPNAHKLYRVPGCWLKGG